MAIKHTKFRGGIRIKGRPKEQAKAEIMIMDKQEAYEDRKRRRRFFALLDAVAVISLVVAIYLFYQGDYLKGALVLLVGTLILLYYGLRKISKNNNSTKRRK